MNVGDRIKQRRIALNIDADELAKRIGKSRATIYRYENGEIENMPTTVLEPIAKALETTPAYLMGWDEDLLQKQKDNRKAFAETWNLQFFEKEILQSFSQLNDNNKKKSISYTKNLLSNQQLENELDVKAAHNDNAVNPAEQEKISRDLANLKRPGKV